MATINLLSTQLGSCGVQSINIGRNSYAQTCSSSRSTAIGYEAKAEGPRTTVVGAQAHGINYATAIGQNAKACGYESIAIGKDVQNSGNSSIAVGNSTRIGATAAVAIGNRIDTSCSDGATSIGYKAPALREGIVIQSGEYCNHVKSRLTIADCYIAFRIGGTCHRIDRNTFFSAFGIT